MANVIERGIYTTLGAGMLVFEAAQNMVKDMVDKGRIAPEEGRRYMDDLSEQVQAQRDELRKRFVDSVQRQAKSADLPTREDVERIMLELEELEKRIALLEAKSA